MNLSCTFYDNGWWGGWGLGERFLFPAPTMDNKDTVKQAIQLGQFKQSIKLKRKMSKSITYQTKGATRMQRQDSW